MTSGALAGPNPLEKEGIEPGVIQLPISTTILTALVFRGVAAPLRNKELADLKPGIEYGT